MMRAIGFAALAMVWPLCAIAQSINQYQSIDQYQQIDQFLNPLVQGLDEQPGVTVVSRLHPDYDAPGVRLGVVTLHGSVDEGVGYDDNVTGTSPSHGSASVDSIGNFSAKTVTSDTTVGLSLEADDHEFLSLSNQSYTNGIGALVAQHNFGTDVLSFSASFFDQKETPRSVGLPALDHPIDTRTEDLLAQYAFTRGRLTIQPGMDLRFYSYDNGTVDNTPFLQSYRNRTQYAPTMTASYEFAAQRKFITVLRDNASVYYGAFPGQTKENFNDFSALAGLSYDVDGVVNVRLLGGYEQRIFSSSAYKAIHAPVVEGALTWTPTELTTVMATVGRYIEDSAADGTEGYTETTAVLTVDHELFRNVIVSANIDARSDEYAQSGGTQYLFGASAGFSWRINRSLRLQAYDTYYNRKGSTAVAVDEGFPGNVAIGQNYAENVFRIRLRLGL